jgi:hypothetical protein
MQLHSANDQMTAHVNMAFPRPQNYDSLQRIRNLTIHLMPDDTKSIIHEVVHEVCERTIKNPVLRPHSPDTPIPVPPPVESSPPTAPEDITPGLHTMSLSTMAALSIL